MKNIIREVVAVSKTVILVGIIIVAGLVTATAYIFLSRPDSPRILDSDSSVSGIIFPEEGGVIETTGIDGNHFKLEIPKDALIEPNGENISITPFTEKENIPLTGDLIAGVMLEPDGLQLYKTATLTIELTNSIPANEVVGFTICENEFHLIPIEINGKTLTFQLIHFSPYGAATGSPSDCATLPEPTSEAKAKQKISCILFNAGNYPDNIGESDRLQIIDAMLTWYSSSIEPNLNNALTDDNLLKPAINEFLAWHFFAVENVEWILQEMPDEIAMCKDDGWSLVDLCIDNAFNRYEQKCSSSLDLAEKKENLNKLIWIEKLIGILEFGERALVRTNVHVFEELCNGAFLQPDSISISPTSATLEIGESESLKATAKNVLGDVIDDRQLVLTWANSNEDAMVLLGSSSIVSVTGKEEGHATITVTAGNTFDPNKVVSAKSEITVKSTPEEPEESTEPEEFSIQIRPSKFTIVVNQIFYVQVRDGDKVLHQDFPIKWSIYPVGIIDFDPINHAVRGISPGIARITTDDEQTTLATITVVLPEKYMLTWKATIDHHSYEDRFPCKDWDSSSEGYEQSDRDGVFEGYAILEVRKIETDYEFQSISHKHFRVTGCWASGHYEDFWRRYCSYFDGVEDWCKRYTYDLSDVGVEFVRYKLEYTADIYERGDANHFSFGFSEEDSGLPSYMSQFYPEIEVPDRMWANIVDCDNYPDLPWCEDSLASCKTREGNFPVSRFGRGFNIGNFNPNDFYTGFGEYFNETKTYFFNGKVKPENFGWDVYWEIKLEFIGESSDVVSSVGGLKETYTQISYAPSYRNIDVAAAYNMISSSNYPDIVVLDVRTQNEYDSGHIHEAVWIPVAELDERIGELAVHKNQEIIVYCGSGGRSVTASEILQSHGFTKVDNMVGGISAWQSAGYTLNPEIIPAPIPIWAHWWFWTTKLTGTIALIGVVYLLKKRKPPTLKIHSLRKSFAKHQNTHSEIRNDTINQQKMDNQTIRSVGKNEA